MFPPDGLLLPVRTTGYLVFDFRSVWREGAGQTLAFFDFRSVWREGAGQTLAFVFRSIFLRPVVAAGLVVPVVMGLGLGLEQQQALGLPVIAYLLAVFACSQDFGLQSC